MTSFIKEITQSLNNNRLRTALTGLAIAWGIIILVVMLGSGKGIENGIRQTTDMQGLKVVKLSIKLNPTKLAYGGFQENRRIWFSRKQFEIFYNNFKEDAFEITPSIQRYDRITTRSGEMYTQIHTLTPKEQQLNALQLLSGRLFSRQEYNKGKRVIIINEAQANQLYIRGEQIIGSMATINGISYEVIGIIKNQNPFFSIMFMPYDTYLNLYPNATIQTTFMNFYPKVANTEGVKLITQKLESYLKNTLMINPEDKNAINISYSGDAYNAMDALFKGLNILLWVMGIGSLSIGIIGVSNIMYVSIQERMREIGIRKSLGAKPSNILSLVFGESIFLSLVSGVIGLIIGVGIVELLDYLSRTYEWGRQTIPTDISAMEYILFLNPQINFSVAIGAIIVLIITGILAGIGPARKAIKIPAIIAMRDNK